MKPTYLLVILFWFFTSCSQTDSSQLSEIQKVNAPISIDGKMTAAEWGHADWKPLDQVWLGKEMTEEDFKGRFKLLWNEDKLFVLVEVHDDTYFDQYDDPLTLWWDDDCVEVFIDEDNSGGDHQYNHNAFAYHVSLDHDVVDMDTRQKGRLFNDHIEVEHTMDGQQTTWEMSFLLFDDTYDEDGKNEPVKLYDGKKLGFALAYCDNDSSKERENFIGSIPIAGEDKNRGWIDAGVFGSFKLVN